MAKKDMASLDIRSTKRLLVWRINALIRKIGKKELPHILIMTKDQLWKLMLSDHLEVLPGNKKVPTEYLYHTKWNIMEVVLKK
jgi:hypothetical protein